MDDLFSRVRTVEERDLLLDVFSRLSWAFYRKGGWEGLLSELPLDVAAAVVPLIRASDTPSTLVAEWKKELGLRPVVTLTVAVPITGRVFDEVVLGFFEKLSPKPLVELVVDGSILAGAIVVYRGKYGDFSLRQAIRRGVVPKPSGLKE